MKLNKSKLNVSHNSKKKSNNTNSSLEDKSLINKKIKDKDKNLIKSLPTKINATDNFIPLTLLNQILTQTNISKRVIEEKNSELFYETLTGKGEIDFINKIHYNGTVYNGLLESGKNIENKCTITFPDSTVYIGEIHQNQITGKGQYIFPSGSTYEGELKNGLRHGFGSYESPEGISYEGNGKMV